MGNAFLFFIFHPTLTPPLELGGEYEERFSIFTFHPTPDFFPEICKEMWGTLFYFLFFTPPLTPPLELGGECES
jgi:hypothetical protein